MADETTIHKVVEKLEIDGLEKLTTAFRRIARSAGSVAQVLNHELGPGLDKSFKEQAKFVDAMSQRMTGLRAELDATAVKWDDVQKKVLDANKALKDGTTVQGKQAGFLDTLNKQEKAWFRSKGGADENTKSNKGVLESLKGIVAKGTFVGNILSKAFEMGVAAIRDFLFQTIELNLAFENMVGRVQGLTLALTKMKGGPNFQTIAQSLKIANASMAEFRDISLQTATPVERIEEAASTLKAPVLGINKSLKDAYEVTRLAAGAAKVYGDDLGTAAGQIAKGIATGSIDGEKGLALILRQEAKVTAKMSSEERYKRIVAVLKKMAGPIDVVATSVGDAVQNFKTLSGELLQRLTYPMFVKIGDAVWSIVNFTREHKKTLEQVVDQVSETFQVVMNLGQAFWDIGKAIFTNKSATEDWGQLITYVGHVLKYPLLIVDGIADGWRIIAETIEVVTDDKRGMGKLLALGEAFEVKVRRAFEHVIKAAKAFGAMVVPDWAKEFIPDNAKKWADNIGKGFMKETDKLDKLALQRARQAGMRAQTEGGRAIEAQEAGIGMSKKDRDDLFASVFGKGGKALINVENVNIKQDFRDQDPNRVMLEFVRDIEQLSQDALQSTVGGGFTDAGPGAVY